MVIYVPGTEETDPKKQNMSLQAIAGAATTAIANVATNTTDIATLNASRASSSAFGLAKVDGTTITAAGGVLTAVAAAGVAASPITASLGSDTAISNSSYTDGPSVAQGSTGTWFASGTVTFLDTSGATQILCKLWDGTTVIASASIATPAANYTDAVCLSGALATPAANLRISCKSTAAGATSTFKFNASSNSKDCTITAYRIA